MMQRRGSGQFQAGFVPGRKLLRHHLEPGESYFSTLPVGL